MNFHIRLKHENDELTCSVISKVVSAKIFNALCAVSGFLFPGILRNMPLSPYLQSK